MIAISTDDHDESGEARELTSDRRPEVTAPGAPAAVTDRGPGGPAWVTRPGTEADALEAYGLGAVVYAPFSHFLPAFQDVDLDA